MGEIPDVPPELLLDLVESVHLLDGFDRSRVKAFLGDPEDDDLTKALEAAHDLALISREGEAPEWGGTRPVRPISRYVASALPSQRKVILRAVLWDRCPPFRTFCQLLSSGTSPGIAATRTKALHELSTPPQRIRERLTGYAVYTGWIVDGAGESTKTLDLSANSLASYYAELASIDTSTESARVFMRQRIGEDTYAFLDAPVIENLIKAIIKWSAKSGAREVIHPLAIAFEGFLRKVGQQEPVTDLSKADGILQIAERLRAAKRLTGKHVQLCGYLSAMRNAADHDADKETGVPWDFAYGSQLTAILVALDSIRSIVEWRRFGRTVL